MPLINFSGLASGIDSEGLIEATSAAARAQRVEPLEETISELEDENDGLGELKTLLTDLKTLLARFSTLNGGVVAKQGTSSDESVLSAIASDTALNGTYSLTVEQLATSATFSFDDRFSDPSDPINASINDGATEADRTVTLDIGTGAEAEKVVVVLSSTTTAAEYVSSFNAASENATASLINVGTAGSPSYAIVISSKNVGTEQGTISIDSIGTEVSTAGSGAFLTNQLDQAVDAEFSISGIAGTITRSSNTVNDVLSGVTLSLESASPGNPVTLTVATDADTTQNNIEEFIEKYNEIVNFLAENNTVVREENGQDIENIFGSLARTSLDDASLTSLRGALSSSAYEEGTAVRIFADIGIVTERDGTLRFNKTTTDNSIANFDNAIAADPDAVNAIFQAFADTTSLTGGTIDQYVRFNGLIDVTVTSSTTRISDLNDRIARAEESIARTEQSLRQRFARLESLTSRLQGQQQALTSALAGLGGNG